MKTLKTVQTISKVGKILSKIAFICSVVGFFGCVIGIMTIAICSGTVTINGVDFPTYLTENTDVTTEILYSYISAGAIYCIAGAVNSFFAEKYFAKELEDGTPFTFDGSEKLMKLGILTICLPLAASILSSIIYGIIKLAEPSAKPADSGIAGSLTLGVMFIILSLICKLGAEEKSQQKDAVKASSEKENSDL